MAGFERTYVGDGASRAAVLEPMEGRGGHPFGRPGICGPSAGAHWAPPGAVFRAVLGEQQLDFASVDEATSWLARAYSMPAADSPSGIFVAWTIIPERGQLDADVYRIPVGGEPVRDLPGGDSSAVRVRVDRPDARDE